MDLTNTRTSLVWLFCIFDLTADLFAQPMSLSYRFHISISAFDAQKKRTNGRPSPSSYKMSSDQPSAEAERRPSPACQANT